jgi:hypothetical protein
MPSSDPHESKSTKSKIKLRILKLSKNEMLYAKKGKNKILL